MLKISVVPGGGTFGAFVILVTVVLVSIDFVVGNNVLDGRDNIAVVDSGDGDDGGGGGGGDDEGRDVTILLFSVYCTGNTRVTGAAGASRVVDSVMPDVVIVVAVVTVVVEELVHGD